MSAPLCTCNHPAHIFACWGDNGECACREHAVPVRKLDAPTCSRCNDTKVVLSAKRNEEGEPMELPCPESTHFQKRAVPRFTVAFDSHDGYWWAIGAGKGVPGTDPVDALRALLHIVTGETLLQTAIPALCDAQNGDSEFFCNLPKGHAADHQSVNLSGNGGSVGWSNRR